MSNGPSVQVANGAKFSSGLMGECIYLVATPREAAYLAAVANVSHVIVADCLLGRILPLQQVCGGVHGGKCWEAWRSGLRADSLWVKIFRAPRHSHDIRLDHRQSPHRSCTIALPPTQTHAPPEVKNEFTTATDSCGSPPPISLRWAATSACHQLNDMGTILPLCASLGPPKGAGREGQKAVLNAAMCTQNGRVTPRKTKHEGRTSCRRWSPRWPGAEAP